MPKSIRIRKIVAPRWKPYPWSKFSPDDCPRQKPLPICPVVKCRRAKQCLAPHKGLFCQRTHFSRAEDKLRTPPTEVDRYIDSLQKPPLSAGEDLYAEYLLEIAAVRRADEREKMKLWRAGAFGAAYGPYTTRGVMMPPPSLNYVEE
jgi:hypothetical protein